VPVFSSRIPGGLALCAANHREAPARLALAVALPAGIYTVERLVWSIDAADPAPHVERLQSVLLEKAGWLKKSGQLNAGEAALYRFLRQDAQVQTSYRAIKKYLWQLKGTRRTEYRWLSVPFGECESNLGLMALGPRHGRKFNRAKYIHRAIVTLAHAQSLCRNFRMQGRLDQYGRPLEEELDRLESALDEMSLACLGLAPGIALDLPDPSHPERATLTVSLANYGGQTIGFVKLGADGPKGARVSPPDTIVFQSVRPGQVVRTTFRIGLPPKCGPGDIIAHIAYLAPRTPVRVRIKAAG
jgi:hypothetical protein